MFSKSLTLAAAGALALGAASAQPAQADYAPLCEPTDLVIYFPPETAGLTPAASRAVDAAADMLAECAVIELTAVAPDADLAGARVEAVLAAFHDAGLMARDTSVAVEGVDRRGGLADRRVQVRIEAEPAFIS